MTANDGRPVPNLDPRVGFEPSPDRTGLRARAISGDLSAMLTLFELFQNEAASLARAVDWLHGLALENHKLEVARRIDNWRNVNWGGHGNAGDRS